MGAFLRELGAEVIDADQIAREIVAPDEEAWKLIVTTFGAEILRPDRSIHRDKLRKIIFKDAGARKKLEAITHPRIRALARERMEKLVAQGTEMIVYEAPLLFENKIHQWLRPVILVACNRDTQTQRLRARDRLTDEQEVERHISAQMPLEKKRELADFVIENDGDLESLKNQVKSVWDRLLATSPARDRSPLTVPPAPDRPPE